MCAQGRRAAGTAWAASQTFVKMHSFSCGQELDLIRFCGLCRLGTHIRHSHTLGGSSSPSCSPSDPVQGAEKGSTEGQGNSSLLPLPVEKALVPMQTRGKYKNSTDTSGKARVGKGLDEKKLRCFPLSAPIREKSTSPKNRQKCILT